MSKKNDIFNSVVQVGLPIRNARAGFDEVEKQFHWIYAGFFYQISSRAVRGFRLSNRTGSSLYIVKFIYIYKTY